jgi:acyl-coenzyme A synthetase/AMP-(fatty) acid ligase/aryl carrier-like protein
MVEHRNIVNELFSQAAQYSSTADHRILQFCSPSFDASVEEILSLALGASLVMCPDTWVRSRERFIASCETYGVSRLAFPVPFWERLVRYGGMPSSVRCVIIGGEAASRESIEAWFALEEPRPVLFNAYGPTETTICASRYRCDADEGRSPPIGRPIANVRIYVLDEYLEPVPEGVAGEIYIGGRGVTRGYLNRAALTAERFIADPYATKAGMRMYRTGDLGRYLSDGNLEYLGRDDQQVKIRGYRIELAEIEARLSEHAGVIDAVVIARDEQGDKRLVAYYRESGEVPVSVESLRAHLEQRLPEHMVPAAYVQIAQWPLSPAGKLDRKALPTPGNEARVTREYEAPKGATEEALARLWSQLLNVERVGRQDNFFELGGHSLLAVSLIEQMRRTGLHADVRTLFATPTFMTFASAVKVIREVAL